MSTPDRTCTEVDPRKQETPELPASSAQDIPSPKANRTSGDSDHKEDALTKGDKWLLLFNAITILVIGFQSYLMRQQVAQANDGLRQNQIALDATIAAGQLDQRAWVGVKSIEMLPMEVGKPLKTQVTILNTGKTPAIDLWHWTLLVTSPTPITDPDEIEKTSVKSIGDPSIIRSAVFPNGESDIGPETKAMLTEEMIEAVKSGKRHVYLIGTLHYKDISGKDHYTRFFRENIPGNKLFLVRPTHNDAN